MAKGKKQAKATGKKPKTMDLPGMEERRIAELHKAAESYVDIRDRRMSLTEQEVEAKQEVLSLMKKHGKETYNYHDADAGTTTEIKIIHEQETVKVKIKKDAGE